MTSPRRTADMSATDAVEDDLVEPDGEVGRPTRRLSVAEMQRAIRTLHDTDPAEVGWGSTSGVRARHTSQRPQSRGLRSTSPVQRATPHTSRLTWIAGESGTNERVNTGSIDVGVSAEWIVVVAAHAGAGASCVALSISDAVTADGRPGRLIDVAPAPRSGLIGCATLELGADPTGVWRRGTRGAAMLFHRAPGLSPRCWPEATRDGEVTVLDVGLPPPGQLTRLLTHRPRLVVVARASIPGVRAAESLLTTIGEDVPIAIAVVGPRRWSGDVTASTGPHLTALRHAGALIAVAEHRRLRHTGATSAELPRPVAATGRRLLRHLEN